MALNIVKYNVSFKMADSLYPTICKVFNDSQIAKSYISGRKKQPVSNNGVLRSYFK